MTKRIVTKVLLIRSSHYADNGSLVKSNRFFDRLTVANLAEMGLPMIAACTPSRIEVEMVDDCLQETPMQTDADVVGISGMLIHMTRAVDLADHFRAQGKVVVMGGFLATQHPELVENHVDALCVGEGERIWPVLNMPGGVGGLTPEAVSKALERAPVATIPYEPGMLSALNARRPLVLASPKSAAAQAIAKLSAQLLT